MKNIAVIGGGTMGAGIAQLAAVHGSTVHLVDVNRDVLDRSVLEIKKRVDRLVEKGKLKAEDRDTTLARIHAHESISELSDVDLAIEAVVENIAVKHKVFTELEESVSESAILATNTSSLSVGAIAESVRVRSRVIGMHFFNPAPLMPLVEIIAGNESDDRAIDAAFNIAQSWGKTPVRAQDTPGFIVNRVARGFYLEALRLLGEGVAGIDEIDSVMRNAAGFRMGPFQLMDLVGLDVNLAVSTSVWTQMDKHVRFTPHEIQKNLVAEGHLGRKTGQGFYLYDRESPIPAYQPERKSFELSPLTNDAMLAFCSRLGDGDIGSTEQYIVSRILAAIINEAGSAFSAGVASSDDIDLAMIKGTNYPKGPLAWADEIGHRTVRGLLKALNEAVGDNRYAPAPVFAEAS